MHVSPDPDLVTYWLAGVIDEERGYGIAGETYETFDQLVELGAPGLVPPRRPRPRRPACLRTELLHEGRRLTEIAALPCRRDSDVGAAVLPMCDEPVQTHVRTDGEWRHFQEYLIQQQSEPEIEGVEFRGAEQARLTRRGRAGDRGGRGDRDRAFQPDREHRPDPCAPRDGGSARALDAPVVAVSPLVGGHSLKGPTEQFMRWAGLEVSDAGVAAHYSGLIDGLVVDRGTPSGRPSLAGVVLHQTDTLMADAAGREHLARETLDFARALSGIADGPHGRQSKVRATLVPLEGPLKVSRRVGVLCNTSLNFKRLGFVNRMSDLAHYCEKQGVSDMVVGDTWFQRVLAAESWKGPTYATPFLVRTLIEKQVPEGATVVVISQGIDKMVEFEGRQGWHFPQNGDGTYRGYHPADSEDAIAHLEEIHAKGASYLAIPESELWWLKFYPGFNEHLCERYKVASGGAAAA